MISAFTGDNTFIPLYGLFLPFYVVILWFCSHFHKRLLVKVRSFLDEYELQQIYQLLIAVVFPFLQPSTELVKRQFWLDVFIEQLELRERETNWNQGKVTKKEKQKSKQGKKRILVWSPVRQSLCYRLLLVFYCCDWWMFARSDFINAGQHRWMEGRYQGSIF